MGCSFMAMELSPTIKVAFELPLREVAGLLNALVDRTATEFRGVGAWRA